MKNRVLAGLAALSAVVTVPAYAILPAGISTGLNGINSDMTSLIDLVWPVVIASVAAVVIFKLFKRFTNKI